MNILSLQRYAKNVKSVALISVSLMGNYDVLQKSVRVIRFLSVGFAGAFFLEGVLYES